LPQRQRLGGKEQDPASDVDVGERFVPLAEAAREIADLDGHPASGIVGGVDLASVRRRRGRVIAQQNPIEDRASSTADPGKGAPGTREIKPVGAKLRVGKPGVPPGALNPQHLVNAAVILGDALPPPPPG
jgi:hypothetical protein